MKAVSQITFIGKRHLFENMPCAFCSVSLPFLDNVMTLFYHDDSPSIKLRDNQKTFRTNIWKKIENEKGVTLSTSCRILRHLVLRVVALKERQRNLKLQLRPKAFLCFTETKSNRDGLRSTCVPCLQNE